ncbi:helix-turn-helix transcriptional regulator [Aneurinibacillus thermoaerophilus]|uniref:helix-turn-helix transcriptional regulator n=1 Tax=Aneurinibacillus thermoaerophilus TaxID=143495 RepID=UPI002E20CB5B|nr:helix-turn-helix transcriptional regulator [Aneurinibacillus thermoaerophilus]
MELIDNIELIDIGRRIRKIRKSKNITLKALSKKTFSVGKLSNIENGIGSVDKNDIELICSALDVPLSEVMKDEETEDIIIDINRASASLAIGNVEIAEKILKKLQKKITRGSEVEEKFYFTLGELYQHIQEYDKAILSFMKAITVEGSIRLRVRAFNAIACIKYKQGSINSAIELSTQALELGETSLKKSYETALTYLNLSIFYCYLRNFSLSKRYANLAIGIGERSIAQKGIYLIAIMGLMQGIDDEIDRKINNSIEYFQRENDLPNLKKALQSRYYLYKDNHKKIKLMLKEAKENIRMFMSATNWNQNKRFVLDLAHTFAFIAIKEKCYEEARDFLTFALEVRGEETKDLDYKTHYLYGSLYREWLKNKEKETFYLRRAVELLPENVSILEKAIILHELFLLEEHNTDSLFIKSSSLFYEFYNQQNKNFEIFNSVILDPQY